MQLLQRRGDCISGCGTSVRVKGTECRKCRRARIVKGKRLAAKERKAMRRLQQAGGDE